MYLISIVMEISVFLRVSFACFFFCLNIDLKDVVLTGLSQAAK